MKCLGCNVEKLSNEFPPMPVTEECEHFETWCMRCVVKYCDKDKGKMECPECKNPFTEEESNIEWYKAILNKMFKEFQANFTPSTSEGKDVLKVVMLNGTCHMFEYIENMTIIELKQRLLENWNIDKDKQKLMFQQKSLAVYGENHTELTLKDHEITPNSTIYLHVIMHTVSENLKNLVFEMSWEFPPSWRRSFFSWFNRIGFKNDKHRDYIDATCFVYKQKTCVEIIDYNKQKSTDKRISHGDTKLDEKKFQGRQTIEVELPLKDEYTHLFFTLSARKATTLKVFPNKKLNFYDEKKPAESLGGATFVDETAQALVMCSLVRNREGQWQVFQNGKSSGGNSQNYENLKRVLSGLVTQGI